MAPARLRRAFLLGPRPGRSRARELAPARPPALHRRPRPLTPSLRSALTSALPPPPHPAAPPDHGGAGAGRRGARGGVVIPRGGAAPCPPPPGFRVSPPLASWGLAAQARARGAGRAGGPAPGRRGIGGAGVAPPRGPGPRPFVASRAPTSANPPASCDAAPFPTCIRAAAGRPGVRGSPGEAARRQPQPPRPGAPARPPARRRRAPTRRRRRRRQAHASSRREGPWAPRGALVVFLRARAAPG
jgi:hypothetical protein